MSTSPRSGCPRGSEYALRDRTGLGQHALLDTLDRLEKLKWIERLRLKDATTDDESGDNRCTIYVCGDVVPMTWTDEKGIVHDGERERLLSETWLHGLRDHLTTEAQTRYGTACDYRKLPEAMVNQLALAYVDRYLNA